MDKIGLFIFLSLYFIYIGQRLDILIKSINSTRELIEDMSVVMFKSSNWREPFIKSRYRIEHGLEVGDEDEE